MRCILHWILELRHRVVVLCITALCLTAAHAGPAEARAPSLSPAAHEALTKAQALLENAQWTEADVVLRRFIEEFSREPVAHATAWHMLGFLLSRTGRDGEALKAYEKALEHDALDAGSAQDIRYNTAQILMSLGKQAQAIERIDAWLAQSAFVTPEQRVQAAWIYLGANAYATAAGHLEQAIQETEVPQASWYQLFIAALQGTNDHQALKFWLPIVIKDFPGEKRYWLQLSSVYLQLKQDRRALATLAAAHHNGLLSEPAEILHLSRLYLYVGVPYKAARILQDALVNGQIAGSAANYEFLADCWLRAHDAPRAINTLQLALQADAGHETSLKLGQLLTQQEQWLAAREHLQQAAESAHERTRAEALLMLGMAYFNSGDTAAARSAFVQARKLSTARQQADNWLVFLDGNPADPGS